MSMTEEQEIHLKLILETTGKLIDSKYRAGQEKHGGNLFELTVEDLIDESIAEALDQLVFLITAKNKLNGVKDSLNIRD